MTVTPTNSLREEVPVRSAVAPRAAYRDYKVDLREDFNSKCGYCDAQDEYFGGVRGYQIDHFAPKSRFPGLELIYENLVYSCPFCNGAKSNKWIGDDHTIPNNGKCGFVDPCNREFDEHLARNAVGKVVAVTRLGEYMLKNLNLYLIRHEFIWQAQKLDQLAERLKQLKPQIKQTNLSLYLEILELLVDLISTYRDYRRRINDG